MQLVVHMQVQVFERRQVALIDRVGERRNALFAKDSHTKDCILHQDVAVDGQIDRFELCKPSMARCRREGLQAVVADQVAVE